MSHREIHVNIPAPAPTPRRPLRLKPVGWLALIIVVLLVVSGSILVVQSILRQTQTLADLPPMSEYTPPPRTPTITPRPTRTPTPGPTATPEGWTLVHDSVTGEEYLSPPPADEAQIREAFEAALGCYYVIGDMPDETQLAQYQQEAQERAERLVEDGDVRAGCAIQVWAAPWGPENPVRCQNYDTCTVGQAKMGSVTQMILYDNDLAQQAGLTAPCVVPIGEDVVPYQLYLAAVEPRDGTWKVIDLQTQTLPEPPAALPGS